jgi:hypothetical protein
MVSNQRQGEAGAAAEVTTDRSPETLSPGTVVSQKYRLTARWA